MEKKDNIFWGIALVAIGVLFLGNSLDWFDFDWQWRKFAQYWPILLILAGVFAFLNRSKSIYNATSALLIALAIPLGIYNCTGNAVDKITDRIEDNVNIDLDDNDFHDNDDENDEDDDSDSTAGERNKQYYAVSIDNSIKEAKLKLEGGAAEFDLEESKDKLFEANTFLKYSGAYKLSEDTKDGVKIVDFDMKSNQKKDIDIDFDDNDLNNDVRLKLSTTPIWEMDLKIGAGELDFDLSKYKVKKVKIETGAASIDVKLGDLIDNVAVDIKSGVASVKIQVPEGVGCEINMDGALNTKDFDDFTKIRSGVWQSPNYDKATKKIKLDVESGLSALKVVRY